MACPPTTSCHRPSVREARGIAASGTSIFHAFAVYRARQRTPKFSRASGPPMARAVSICATPTRFTFAARPICRMSAIAVIAGEVNAARLKDAGQRNDVEAGMAKLLASEYCAEVVQESFRIHGG